MNFCFRNNLGARLIVRCLFIVDFYHLAVVLPSQLLFMQKWRFSKITSEQSFEDNIQDYMWFEVCPSEKYYHFLVPNNIFSDFVLVSVSWCTHPIPNSWLFHAMNWVRALLWHRTQSRVYTWPSKTKSKPHPYTVRIIIWFYMPEEKNGHKWRGNAVRIAQADRQTKTENGEENGEKNSGQFKVTHE